MKTPESTGAIDPKWFLGKKIVHKVGEGEGRRERRGEVDQIMNLEGLNTMFRVIYNDGDIVLDRIIYKYLEGSICIDHI